MAAAVAQGKRVVREKFGVDADTCAGDHSCIAFKARWRLRLIGAMQRRLARPQPSAAIAKLRAAARADDTGAGSRAALGE